MGKELLAQGIHEAGKGRGRRFLAANCGVLVPGLMESELFGCDPGALIGARRQGRPGLFLLAMVCAKVFRADLCGRLDVVAVQVPPLAER